MPVHNQRTFLGVRRLLRSARKEWLYLRDSRRIFSNDGLQLALLLSGALLVGSLILSWKRQEQKFRVTNQTEANLLNARVRGSMVTALDWGQRDGTYNHMAGTDPGFVDRELSKTPIVHDGQSVLLVGPSGRFVYDSLAKETSGGGKLQDRVAIRTCLLERLQHLQENTGATDRNAYGLLCRLPDVLVLGAATRVTRSGPTGDALGWIVQYGVTPTEQFEGVSTSVLGEIAPKLALISQEKVEARRPIGNDPKESLVYFLAAEKPGQVWVLRQPWVIRDIVTGAFTDTLLPWATVNLALLGLTLASLSSARRIRLQHCREQRRSRRLLHNYRILDQGRDLLSLPAFLEIAGRPERPTKSGPPVVQLLGDMTAQIHTFSIDTDSQISTQASLVASLHERVRDLLPKARICRTPENSLALLTPCDENDGNDTMRALETAIADTRQKFASSVRADIRAALTPLQPASVEKQISDLALLNRYGVSDRTVVLLPTSDDNLLAKVREKISGDFAATTFAEQITDVKPRLEDVIRIVDGETSICYREMLFRFPEGQHPLMEIQELILALERNNNIHLIDLLMLRKALAILSEGDRPLVQVGANLSAQTVQNSLHREAILSLLREAPVKVRQLLILEVTETAIIGGPELWKGFLLELGDLGVKVSIDDFGSGYASLSHLFEFHADFIKVDMKYTRMVPNHEVTSMVKFLLSFESNSATRVIMEGIETEEQLRHWQGVGVSHFQGYLFSPHS